MHVLSNTSPINMGRHGMLAPGEWVCHDRNAAELLLMAERGSCSIRPYFRGNWEGSKSDKFLVVRSGAIGDLLFLSPVLPTNCALACFKTHHEIACDFGTGLVEYPVLLSVAQEFSYLVSLEDVMESHPDKHATDCFASALEVDVADYKPRYVVNELERAAAMIRFPRTKAKRIGIQPICSTRNRDYPLPYWLEVFNLLARENVEIFLFGSPGQIPDLKHPHVTNLSQEQLTFRQSAAVLSTCDVFCGVDSSLLHLCHALEIPAVGLYAAFDWKARTSKSPLTWSLTGVGDCAPCNWHKQGGSHFPPDKPCARLGNCHVLATIKPDRIVAKINFLPYVIAPSTN